MGTNYLKDQLQQDLHEYLPKEKQSGMQSGSEQNFHVVVFPQICIQGQDLDERKM